MWFDTYQMIEFITKPNSPSNIQFYDSLKKGVLLDTSPLYLMIIGKYDSDNNTHFLKHFQFDLADFRYMINFVNSINRYPFFITSNIFTEFVRNVKEAVRIKNNLKI